MFKINKIIGESGVRWQSKRTFLSSKITYALIEKSQIDEKV